MSTHPKLRSVAVYCGSTFGKNPAFVQAAKELGELMLKRNISLIYGGGSHGVMGTIAQTVHDGGGKVEGIMTDFFVGLTKPLIGETIIVEDMHARKKLMCVKADAFIALPGGIGTMEEIVEMISWSKLGFHNKPIGMLNIADYYQGFFNWCDTALNEGFITNDDSNIINISNDCQELLDALESKLPANIDNK